jgi:hypothetical protein
MNARSIEEELHNPNAILTPPLELSYFTPIH